MSKPKGSRGPERESRPAGGSERLRMSTLTGGDVLAITAMAWPAQRLTDRHGLAPALAIIVAPMLYREARS